MFSYFLMNKMVLNINVLSFLIKLKFFHKFYNFFFITINDYRMMLRNTHAERQMIEPNNLFSGYTSSKIFYLHCWNGCRFSILTTPWNGIVLTREDIPNLWKCQGYIINITRTLKLINNIKTTKNNTIIMGTV